MRQRYDLLDFVVDLLFAAAVAVALAIVVHAAPVPLPRPAKPARPKPPTITAVLVVGTYDMLWSGHWDRATFHLQGGYQCRWHGTDWVGTWSVNGNTLTVKETIPPQAGNAVSWLEWSAVMEPGTRQGKTAGDVPFELKTPKPTD